VTVAAEVEAEIARLFAVEHWKVGTIAAQLGIHHDVVKRVLGLLPAQPRPEPMPLLIAPYDEFIKETLLKYPRLRSTRILDMIKERGYRGSERTLRRFVTTVRPTPTREAFLRLDPLIGEQAQVDWAHVGQIPVPGGGSRSLWLFVMVLSWSRAMWGEFCFDTTVHSLLRSLVRAASFFGGSTRQWLFDNPKIVVLERHGDVARFHPLLLDLGSAMHVQLRLCAPYRGNEKGRVERKIRFLRDRFLAGRDIHSIEQGNRDLLAFIDTIAHQQHHPNFPQRTIADCLVEEKQRLLPLPSPMPATDLVTSVAVDKTRLRTLRHQYLFGAARSCRTHPNPGRRRPHRPTARRGLPSSPSIPAPLVSAKRSSIPTIAPRSFVASKARPNPTGGSRLRAAAPDIDVLVERWVEAGRNVGSMTARTTKLLDLYGQDVFAKAITETIERGTHDPGEVGVLCEKHRRAAEHPVPIHVPLSSHVLDRDVIPHDLGGYDVKR
jgi:transposase